MLISRVVWAGLIAISVCFGVVFLHRMRRAISDGRLPTSEKLLRPPGHSLSQKLAEFEEKLLYCVIFVVGAPILFAYQTQKLSIGVFLVYLIPMTLLCGVPLYIAFSRARNYVVGLLGERAVGEELNQLMRDGCHVFHDYPGGHNWNIDHIVVAPSGVYAIETKSRRKRRAPKGQRSHEVVFDGKTLQFPESTDSSALEQARRNATSLGQQLSSATGEQVKAMPVLTFPGWYVTLKGKSDVHVLNPKQIRQVVLHNTKPPLSTAQFQRITHQLDQKCRDVEL